jgi:hypothetical protein
VDVQRKKEIRQKNAERFREMVQKKRDEKNAKN